MTQFNQALQTMAQAVDRIKELEEELHELKRQGGEINMERSWKMKYKYALQRANDRLMMMGQPPVRIRNQKGEMVNMVDIVEHEDGQLSFDISK